MLLLLLSLVLMTQIGTTENTRVGRISIRIMDLYDACIRDFKAFAANSGTLPLQNSYSPNTYNPFQIDSCINGSILVLQGSKRIALNKELMDNCCKWMDKINEFDGGRNGI